MTNHLRSWRYRRAAVAHFLRLRHPLVVAVVAVAAISGCTSQPTRVNAPPLTLASTSQLPANEIARFYSPEQWQKLRTLPYVAYVVVSGEIFNDRLKVEHIVHSFPDHRYDATASDLLQGVTLKAYSVGTHITPAASAWVILYPKEMDGSLALIYARQAYFDAPPNIAAPQFFRAQLY